MSAIARMARVGVAACCILALAECTRMYDDHGWAPTQDDLAEISVGMDTRATVAEKLGEPGTTGLLADSGWYYVQSRFEQYGYRAPKEVDRQVVAISFNDQGVVENVERFGLADGQVVVLSRRVTDSNTKGIGLLRQLLGSVGRVNPSTLFGGPSGPGIH